MPGYTPELWQAALEQLAVNGGWTGSERRFHLHLVARHAKRLRALRRHINSNALSRAHRLQNEILKSHSAAACAVLEELVVQQGLKTVPSISAVDFEKLACAVQPMSRLFSHGFVVRRRKANGSRRVALSPSRPVRIAQRVVGHALDCWRPEGEFEYNHKGRGRNAAVREVVRLIDNGTGWFVQFDIENFFPSVKLTHLHGKLPLPRQAIQHTVFYNSSAVLLGTKLTEAEAEAARHGLPAGARLSGKVAAMFLGRELRTLSGAKGIVVYVDDGIIGCCDPAGAEALVKALTGRFANHPGGPLSFKFIKIVTPEEGISFLGYWIRRITMDGEEQVIVRPSHEAKQKLKKRLFERLRRCGPSLQWDEAVEVAHRYAQYWRNQFPLWQPTDHELFDFQGEVETYVSDFLSGFTAKLVPQLASIACKE